MARHFQVHLDHPLCLQHLFAATIAMSWSRAPGKSRRFAVKEENAALNCDLVKGGILLYHGAPPRLSRRALSRHRHRGGETVLEDHRVLRALVATARQPTLRRELPIVRALGYGTRESMRKKQPQFTAAFSFFTAYGIDFPDARFHDIVVVAAKVQEGHRILRALIEMTQQRYAGSFPSCDVGIWDRQTISGSISHSSRRRSPLSRRIV